MSRVRPMRPAVLLAALSDAKVDFLLIGGLAATMRGTTRVTNDIDIAYSAEGRNLERLCAVINALTPQQLHLGEVHGGVIEVTPALLKRTRMLQLATTLGDVDLLSRVDGFRSYGALRSMAAAVPLSNVAADVAVLTTEGLLKAKRALKRPKDVQDIVELEALREIELRNAPLDAVADETLKRRKEFTL